MKKPLIKYFLLFLLGANYACSYSISDNLKCHYRIADITPLDSVVLAGFAARQGLSKGIHRPLKSHCLVIRNDTARICIISNDLMEVSTEFSDAVREDIAKRSGLPAHCIFMHSTHTHSAPRTGGACTQPGAPNHTYRQQAAKIIADNAVATLMAPKAHYRAFQLSIATSTCDMSENRCEKDGPCDHTVYAVRFLDAKQKPFLALLNYGCHPVSLNHRSHWISTDYPGIACEILEEAWECPVFHFTGAAGNIDPAGGLKADTNYTHAKGLALASSIQNAHFTKLPKNNILKLAHRDIHLPYQIDTITKEAITLHTDLLTTWKGVSATWIKDVYRWRDDIYKRLAAGDVLNYLPFRIGAANIGGLLFLFTQGEPFCEFQQNLRSAFPLRHILFIAYANGQNSYLPSRHAYKTLMGYEYEVKQMHVYIHAPYPLSENMPETYQAGITEIITSVQ